MPLYHGANTGKFTAHIGLCLVRDQDIARSYTRRDGVVYEVALDLGPLEVVEVDVSRENIDNNNWPGDTAEGCAAFAASGADVIRYIDMTESGTTHTTYRLVSERAVAAVSGAAALVEADEE